MRNRWNSPQAIPVLCSPIPRRTMTCRNHYSDSAPTDPEQPADISILTIFNPMHAGAETLIGKAIAIIINRSHTSSSQHRTRIDVVTSLTGLKASKPQDRTLRVKPFIHSCHTIINALHSATGSRACTPPDDLEHNFRVRRH